MSGSTVIAPNTTDTTLFQDGQAVNSIPPSNVRQLNDSLSSLPFTTQTGTTYTFVATDFGTCVQFNNSAATTVTVPANVFTTGNIVYGRAIGTGQVTIAAGSGFTLNVAASLALTPIQWATWSIHFTSATTGVLM
jgi:hypothetical protein